jgi:predicted outer membrane protein
MINYEILTGENTFKYKGNDPAVKSFGALLWQDHKKAKSDLLILTPTLFPGLTLTDSAYGYYPTINYLEGLSGYTYDTAYLNAEIRDKVDKIRLFERGVIGAIKPATRNYAAKWLPRLVLHKKIADSLLANLAR